MEYLLVIAVAYLLGCSNMALYLSRIKKVDARAGGSGNLGASNATALMGWRAGIAVAVHDIGKSALAVILARFFFPALPYIGAAALGVAQRALEEAIAYSKTREQFGQPICNNQGLRFMLADMEIKTEAARCLVYHVAQLMDRKEKITMNGSIAKCFATDAAMQVTIDAVQIFGGYGYTKEYPVEKLMRDAKIFQIVEGTNQIQRVVISGQLLK